MDDKPKTKYDSGSDADDSDFDLGTPDPINFANMSDSSDEEISEEEEDMEINTFKPVAIEDFQWSEDYSSFNGREETFDRPSGPKASTADPYELFCLFWDRDILQRIVEQTNLYAWQTVAQLSKVAGDVDPKLRPHYWVNTTVNELYLLLAVFISMSLGNFLEEEIWPLEFSTHPKVSKIMSYDRFKLLMRFLHFVDNSVAAPDPDIYDKRLSKIQPLIDLCNERFSRVYDPGRYLGIMETPLIWRGSLTWRQSVRNKAAGYGIQSHELSEVGTGYVLKMSLFAGMDVYEDEIRRGFKVPNAKAVLKLMEGYLDQGRCLIINSQYNQIVLVRYLKARGTDVVGALRRHSGYVPEAVTSLEERQLRRGQVVARHCGDVSVVAWRDHGLMTMVSTFHNAQLAPARLGRKLSRPLVYEDCMRYQRGIVECEDQETLTRILESCRGQKWYMKVFKWLIITSVQNAYVVHLANCTSRPLSRRQFASALVEQLAQRHPVASTLAHWDRSLRHLPRSAPPLQPDTKGENCEQFRCACCSSAERSSIHLCDTCQVALCAGRCWIEYHALQRSDPQEKLVLDNTESEE